MTTLVVEELVTTLTQELTLSFRPRAHISHVRPYLYVHNTPAGTFTLSIRDSLSNVLSSGTFTAQDIYDGLATTNDYAHAYFRVTFASVVPAPPGNYSLHLSSSGYTFSESAYLGWVREHEDLKVPITYTPANDFGNPLSYEIWVNA